MIGDQMRYLWFVWLPAPKRALVVGLLVLGALIGMCAAGLIKITRPFEANEGETLRGRWVAQVDRPIIE